MDLCEYVLRESKDFFDKLSNGHSSSRSLLVYKKKYIDMNEVSELMEILEAN
jgi:hypothetical protein